MKAIVARQWCEPSGLKVEEVDRPTPGAGQVLVKVHSAALNFPDILMVAGKYQVKPPLPFTPGFEVAGTIDSVGPGTTGFSPGQRRCWPSLAKAGSPSSSPRRPSPCSRFPTR